MTSRIVAPRVRGLRGPIRYRAPPTPTDELGSGRIVAGCRRHPPVRFGGGADGPTHRVGVLLPTVRRRKVRVSAATAAPTTVLANASAVPPANVARLPLLTPTPTPHTNDTATATTTDRPHDGRSWTKAPATSPTSSSVGISRHDPTGRHRCRSGQWPEPIHLAGSERTTVWRSTWRPDRTGPVRPRAGRSRRSCGAASRGGATECPARRQDPCVPPTGGHPGATPVASRQPRLRAAARSRRCRRYRRSP